MPEPILPVEEEPETEPPVEPDEGGEAGWSTAKITGDRVNVFDAPIVAGDPAGSRIEIRSTGLHAFNGTGTETARIDGAEGVFVGGEFRTSDSLPGQVQLSDDGYITHLDGAGTFPGIRITPIDTTDMEYPAGIGPSENGLTIYSGRRVGGESSIVQATPGASFMRAYRAGGGTGGVMQTSPEAALMRAYSGNGSESGYIQADPTRARLGFLDSSNSYVSRIHADADEAYLYTHAGGAGRYLSVDADGVWVKTNKSGSWKWYNLEETAQDSGWQSITFASGITATGFAGWRNKGGMIYFRGVLTAAWTAGWNTVATGLPEAMRPVTRVVQNAPHQYEVGQLWRMQNTGELQFYKPAANTMGAELSGLFYPIG